MKMNACGICLPFSLRDDDQATGIGSTSSDGDAEYDTSISHKKVGANGRVGVDSNSKGKSQDPDDVIMDRTTSMEEDDDDAKLMGSFLDAIRENSNETKSSSAEEEDDVKKIVTDKIATSNSMTPQTVGSPKSPKQPQVQNPGSLISLASVKSSFSNQSSNGNGNTNGGLSPTTSSLKKNSTRHGSPSRSDRYHVSDEQRGADSGRDHGLTLVRTKTDPPAAESFGGGGGASVSSLNSKGSNKSGKKGRRSSFPSPVTTINSPATSPRNSSIVTGTPNLLSAAMTPRTMTHQPQLIPTVAIKVATPSTPTASMINHQAPEIEEEFVEEEGVVKQVLKTLDYLDERNFDTDPTELYVCLMRKDWTTAYTRALDFPKEACAWIYRKEVDGVALRWRLLPIHAAIIFSAPERIIDALLLNFPDSVMARDDQGMTPVHLAIRMSTSASIILKLLKINPDTITIKDKKGRTPRNLAESTRGATRDQFLEILENAPKTTQQIRDEIISEQQVLFEQVLNIVKREHYSEIEKWNREAAAQKIQLNAQIEVLQQELKKQEEKCNQAEKNVTDIEERMKLKIEQELQVMKQVETLEKTIQDITNDKAEAVHLLEQITNEKALVHKALDASELNHDTTKAILKERENAETAQAIALQQEKSDLVAKVASLEKLLQERTESEQALAWQVSALAEKLGGGFGGGGGGGASTCAASIFSEEDGYQYFNAGPPGTANRNTGGDDDDDDCLSPSTTGNDYDIQADGHEDPTTSEQQQGSTLTTGAGPLSPSRGNSRMISNLSGHSKTTTASEIQHVRTLEKERDELKTTVNKLSIKLYKVVGFLDEMVQEQEAIVKEAMKRDGNDSTTSNIGKKNEQEEYVFHQSGGSRTTEVATPLIGSGGMAGGNSSIGGNSLSSTAAAAAEQILDSVPASDRRKLVTNVSGMKDQIIGVIDSVIDSMPKTSPTKATSEQALDGARVGMIESYDDDDDITADH
jgi:hypothetical protein